MNAHPLLCAGVSLLRFAHLQDVYRQKSVSVASAGHKVHHTCECMFVQWLCLLIRA